MNDGSPAPGTKHCTGCRELRQTAMYSFRAPQGLRNDCKACEALVRDRSRVRYLSEREGQPLQAEKRCPRCKHTLPSDKFGKSWGTKDGLTADCMACMGKRAMDVRRQRRELFGGEPPVFTHAKERICTQCKAVTPWKNLGKDANVMFGVVAICKKCQAVMRRTRYQRRKPV